MVPSLNEAKKIVRPATPADVSALWEMKRKLEVEQNSEIALRATSQDWARDGFGPQARFFAFVVEIETTLVGMITCSERYYTGWAGSTMYIQDMYVESDQRRRGIGKLLLGQVALFALERNCPLIELTVRRDNSARYLYKAMGFERVSDCLSYVASLEAMTILAGKVAECAGVSTLVRPSPDRVGR